MKTILTAQKLRDIYTDPQFRNDVAYAHGVYKNTTDKEPIQRVTCSYPVAYIVTLDQIAEANAELERAKAELLASTRGKLVLIGMGMVRKENDELMTNHRVRGHFINRAGGKCFVEFLKGREHPRAEENRMLYPDHAMIDGLSIQAERKNWRTYTEQNALAFVNKFFDCDFKEIFIDNFTLSPEEITSDCRMSEVSA